MDAEAARQPGYIGMDSVRAADGEGITIRYWEKEADAVAWCAHREHTVTRECERAQWDDQ